MALSPENRELFLKSGWLNLTLKQWSIVNDAMDAARAQGRASLEERVRLLEEGLENAQRDLSACAALFERSRKFKDRFEIIKGWSARARTLLATPGERENG